MHMIIFIFVASVFLAVVPTLAAEPVQFERDKQMAEQRMTPLMQQQCLADFQKKRADVTRLEPLGDLHFDVAVSQEVYDALYWKDSNRGVAFSLPVKAHLAAKGERVADITCFFAVDDDKPVFQYAQHIPRSF